jgi:uncharacterized protein YdiU (UPF0061 family)
MSFHWDNSYRTLPEVFFTKHLPEATSNPSFVLRNDALFKDLGLHPTSLEELLNMLSGQVSKDIFPYAQAYAGHQFGHFTMLGDGRALHLGEHLTPQGQRFDVQLKGAGRTAFSRGGDGRATLRSMLREYLISEAMHGLGIESSRSLCLIKTGSEVLRERVHEGAVLTRVMKSHIRVGTFEYARYFCETSDLEALFHYTLNRLYPSLNGSSSPVEDLFMEVMRRQIDTVCQWMRVGFIHGVMNTDNTSISGETFDYGPCAFMNAYHLKTVFSSIDRNGRYAFGSQPSILHWNLTRWLESLLPLLHNDEKKAILRAKEMLREFEPIWERAFGTMMRAKIGCAENHPESDLCWQELLRIMEKHALDYTDTFVFLTYGFDTERFAGIAYRLNEWLNQWRGMTVQKPLMKESNPVMVPRNHWVEERLDAMERGQDSGFHQGLVALTNPYVPENFSVNQAPSADYDRGYSTYCGT